MMLSTPEVAARLQLDRSQIRRLARTHSKGRLIGRTRMFTPPEVRWLASHRPTVGRPKNTAKTRSRQKATQAA